ncbi:hypothetical protein [Magnetospirillum moscoviense]|uniref:Uncharacterized protein n=1 Tax=Magnetospirillum moscoviense TaxID=1437059 RepID=A0A178MZ46_9PROT|nr:hypothetical protein [Magnetospirillum moscoviense]OAN60956.1 hypothetical protein A6A05_07040 [Magnetospirillum moscoviense]
MSEIKHVVIGGMYLPLDVEALESLPINPGGVIQFTFLYANISFAARYDEGEHGGRLRLVGDVGPLPYSAESPEARAGLAQIIRAANDVLGPCFRTAQGRILLGADASIARPVTAVSLIAQVAASLIPAKPYLDVISVYVRPPLEMARPGTSSVRPEWRRRRA